MERPRRAIKKTTHKKHRLVFFPGKDFREGNSPTPHAILTSKRYGSLIRLREGSRVEGKERRKGWCLGSNLACEADGRLFGLRRRESEAFSPALGRFIKTEAGMDARVDLPASAIPFFASFCLLAFACIACFPSPAKSTIAGSL